MLASRSNERRSFRHFINLSVQVCFPIQNFVPSCHSVGGTFQQQGTTFSTEAHNALQDHVKFCKNAFSFRFAIPHHPSLPSRSFAGPALALNFRGRALGRRPEGDGPGRAAHITIRGFAFPPFCSNIFSRCCIPCQLELAVPSLDRWTHDARLSRTILVMSCDTWIAGRTGSVGCTRRSGSS